MARYVIIGAGAIGGGVGALLARSGVDVVLVARGPHARAMQGEGVRLRTPEGESTVPVRCITGPDEIDLRTDDVLVLTTKTHQADAALRAWVDQPLRDGRGGSTAGATLPVVTALNGVTSESIALRYFDRVIGACVWMPAVHLEPGEVIVRSTPTRGLFHVGAVPADRDESAVLDLIESDWEGAELRISRPDDVMPWKYRKLLMNLGNAVQALVSAPREELTPIVGAARAEAEQVLAAAGIEVTDDGTEREMRRTSGVRIERVPDEPVELGGSSWQSLARGTGDIETDYLNGEIARIARAHGGSAPINAKLAELARRAAARRSDPGSFTVAELGRLVGA